MARLAYLTVGGRLIERGLGGAAVLEIVWSAGSDPHPHFSRIDVHTVRIVANGGHP